MGADGLLRAVNRKRFRTRECLVKDACQRVEGASRGVVLVMAACRSLT